MRIHFKAKRYRLLKGWFTAVTLEGPLTGESGARQPSFETTSSGAFHPFAEGESSDLDWRLGQDVRIDLWSIDALGVSDGEPLRIHHISCGNLRVGETSGGRLEVEAPDSPLLLLKALNPQGASVPGRKIVLMDVDHVATHEIEIGPGGSVALVGLLAGTYVAEIADRPDSTVVFELRAGETDRVVVLRERV